MQGYGAQGRRLRAHEISIDTFPQHTVVYLYRRFYLCFYPYQAHVNQRLPADIKRKTMQGRGGNYSVTFAPVSIFSRPTRREQKIFNWSSRLKALEAHYRSLQFGSVSFVSVCA